ncbi:MAG TPA: hypothetical protein VK537_07540 [Galbitalea sp.]|nr:hypothetical protein [Galbitalea sp.]
MAMGKPRKGVGVGSGTQAARTASGGVSAAARAKTGSGKGKSFPLPDEAAAKSAINLRHNGSDMTAKQVLDKVAGSKFAKNPVVKAKIAKARKVDRGGK